MVGGASVQAAERSTGLPSKPKKIIYLVADGMGTGSISYAHHWQLKHTQQPLNYVQMLARPDMHRALQDTASASSPVTDSSAAASAWGSGQRIENGKVNISTSGQSLKPILSYAKEAGLGTGLVTTCRITHATPAGFAANAGSRDMEDVIAQQYLAREIDVLLGGGDKFFQGNDALGNPFDLYPQFEAKGYSVAKTADVLKQVAGAGRLLGVFSRSHIPYAIDRAHQVQFAGVPTLPEMFAGALKSLETHSKGFLLQVEAGRVDHAGHGNDAASILHEMLEFDAVVGQALSYVDAHPDTLLIVTTDHGTGGCQLNGQGKKYSDSGPALDRVERFKGSFELLEDLFRNSGEFDRDYFTKITGLAVTEAQAKLVQSKIDQSVSYLSSAMTEVFAAELLEATAVGWTSNNHTSECVDLYAFGAGAEALPTFVKNYEMFGFMRKALSI